MSTPASEPSRDADPAARVEALYAEHAGLVRSVCRNLLRNGGEAEDAVQQTFLSAQRALLNGSSPREPAAWLAAIARNECLGRVQARMREPLPVDEETRDVAADTHAVAVRRHEAGELRQAISELPAQQREAILLRELRGLSYEEVATTLSVTTSAVESLIFRARRSLQTRLREALAALSPGELAGRILGGGSLAAPVAAKVAAIGVGTALVTGGAVLGPKAIGLGNAPRPAKAAHHPAAAATAEPSVPTTVRPTRIWLAPARPQPQDVSSRETGDTSSSGGSDSSQAESSDTSASSSGGEREASGGTTGGGATSQETETTSSGGTGTGGDSSSGTQTTVSGSSDGSSTGGSGDSTTTTTATTPDQTTTTTADVGAIDN